MVTGHTPMPWGRHKGTPLANVPPDYLLDMYQKNKFHGQYKEYIISQLAAIRTGISKLNLKTA